MAVLYTNCSVWSYDGSPGVFFDCDVFQKVQISDAVGGDL
jgi:hypothetical protein